MDDAIWDVTVFTKNRDRLLEGEIAAKFLRAVLAQPKVKALLSDEHFSVDGTLIQAWASMKSFRPKDGSGEPPAPGRNGERDFHGEQRTNDTHASTTDPARPGQGRRGVAPRGLGLQLQAPAQAQAGDGRVTVSGACSPRCALPAVLVKVAGWCPACWCERRRRR